MKKTNILLLTMFAAFLFLFAENTSAQWSQTNGPFGGVGSCVAVKDAKVFAGTEDGIYASNNGGVSWFPSNTGIPAFDYRTVSQLMIRGNDIFAGVANKLYRSADNGNLWNQLPMTGVTSFSSFLALTHNSNFIFASLGKAYRSADNGNTWSSITGGLPTNITITALAATDNFLYAGSVSHGVFVSTNNGTSWSTYNSGLPGYYVPAITIHGQVIHAATFSGGVYQSTLNGNSWIPANNGLPQNRYVHGLNLISNALFAVTGSGVFKSVDDGATWNSSGAGLPGLTYKIAGDATNYFASTYAGLYKSNDGGATWTDANQNITSTRINKIAAKNNKIFASVQFKGIARSLNSGVTWDYLSNGVSINESYPLLINSGNNIITTPEAVSGNGRGMLISTNDGDSWSQITNGVSASALVGILITEGDNVYGAMGRKVISSTNNGDSFTTGSDIFALPYATLTGLAASPTTLYAATTDGLFLSQDKGITWDSVAADFPEDGMLKAFAYNDGMLYLAGYSAGIHYSSNEGVSWVSMNNLPGDTRINSFSFYENKIFAGSDMGVLISPNNGQSWQIVNNGLTFNAMQVTTITKSNTDNLFIGTFGSGVWKSFAPDFTVTSIGNEGITSPKEFALQQNYPNPFNPSTTINYKLLKAGFVSLKVYDLSGKEVAEMVNGLQTAGDYSLSFNASSLSSGMYFYTIKTEGFTDTKKMILLK